MLELSGPPSLYLVGVGPSCLRRPRHQMMVLCVSCCCGPLSDSVSERVVEGSLVVFGPARGAAPGAVCVGGRVGDACVLHQPSWAEGSAVEASEVEGGGV